MRETKAMIVDSFTFNDFCLSCQKVMEHRISKDGNEFFGTCVSCGRKRVMTDLNQVYYPKTDLWVTRFKIGNLPCVVIGKLLHAASQRGKSPE